MPFIQIRNYIVLAFFLFIGLPLFACQCIDPPKTFIKSLSEFTAEVEVVAIDTLHIKEYRRNYTIILSKLKIRKSFSGNSEMEYVWMLNGDGANCLVKLHPNSVGEKYIISGFLSEDLGLNEMHKNEDVEHYLHASICGVSLLKVEGMKVVGTINKTTSNRFHRKYNRMAKKDEEKANQYRHEVLEKKGHQDNLQRMPKSKFYRLMNRRV